MQSGYDFISNLCCINLDIACGRSNKPDFLGLRHRQRKQGSHCLYLELSEVC